MFNLNISNWANISTVFLILKINFTAIRVHIAVQLSKGPFKFFTLWATLYMGVPYLIIISS